MTLKKISANKITFDKGIKIKSKAFKHDQLSFSLREHCGESGPEPTHFREYDNNRRRGGRGAEGTELVPLLL